MKRSTRHLIQLLLVSVFGSFVPNANAQTVPLCPAPVEVTSARICWTAVTRADGTAYPAGTVVKYDVQRQVGTVWTAVGVTSETSYLAHNLPAPPRHFRVFATAEGLTSPAGNSRYIDQPPPPPPPPPPPVPVVIAINGTSASAPVYRILGSAPNYTRGETLFGLVPVGSVCSNQIVYRYRGVNFHRVTVLPEDVWPSGTSTANLAAPCAPR